MKNHSTRRRFLEISGAGIGVGGLGPALSAGPVPLEAQPPAANQSDRPKIAAIATVYYYLSHAYHIVGRFLDGFMVYDGNGLHKPPFEIASLFIEQVNASDDDLGRAKAEHARRSLKPDDRRRA